MTAAPERAACFLCGAPSEYRELGAPERRHYLCSAAGCGEYSITRRAQSLIEILYRAKVRRQELRQVVAAAAAGQLVEIDFNPGTNAWETNLVEANGSHGQAS